MQSHFVHGRAIIVGKRALPDRGALYFVRHVAEAHGGELRLSNGPDGAVAEMRIQVSGDARENGVESAKN